jgi:hypothetical protein
MLIPDFQELEKYLSGRYPSDQTVWMKLTGEDERRNH